MKAFLIDPEACSITEFDFDYDDNSLRPIYDAIDAAHFDVVMLDDHGNCLYVDDEGLYTKDHYFKVGTYNSPLAGKALLLGTNNEGETTEPTDDVTIEQLENQITFISGETALEMAEVLDAMNKEAMKIYGPALICTPVADIIKDRVYDGSPK